MNRLAMLSASLAPLLSLGCLDSGPGTPTAPENGVLAEAPEAWAASTPDITVLPSGLRFLKGAEAPPDTSAQPPDSNALRNEEMTGNFGPMKAVSLAQASAKIAAGEPYIILYQNIGYTGAQFIIHGYRDYNALAFSEAGDWNDKVSSIKFFNGAKAHFWVANDYKGGYYTWSANVPDLRVHTFNDVISSVSWDLPLENDSRYVWVCTDPGCATGGKTNLYYPLDYNRLPRWEGVGEFNNTISEVKFVNTLPGGAKVYFYHDDSWGSYERDFLLDAPGSRSWSLQGDYAFYDNVFSSLKWDK